MVGDPNYNDFNEETKQDSQETPGLQSKDNRQSIPTFSIIAREIEQKEGIKLDKKQYIAYEIISCTFLLGFICDG